MMTKIMWNFRTGPINLIDSKLKKKERKKESKHTYGTKVKKYPRDIYLHKCKYTYTYI